MSPKPRREPHVMVAAGISRNSKLAGLPGDTARLGYFYAVLGEAKLLRPAGRFASRGQWREVAGRFARFLPQYLARGLMEEAPALCKRCAPRWPSLPAGTLVVHDWHEHQVDPGAAGRAQDWRQSRGQADDEPPFDERSIPVQSAFDERSIGVRSTHAGSRARREVERRTLNVNESGTNNGRSSGLSVAPDRPNGQASDVLSQLLTPAQLAAWLGFGHEWDDFKRAWIGHGFRLPPAGDADDDPEEANPSQRAMLHSVMVDRPESIVEWIRESKARTAHEVIGHVLERWHALRGAVARDDEAKPEPQVMGDDPASYIGGRS